MSSDRSLKRIMMIIFLATVASYNVSVTYIEEKVYMT
jgi:hypothetical protein